MIDLQDKPIAITGASSGIGRATALACARTGMPVAVMARRREMLDELVDEIRRGGGRATAFAGSVDDADACVRFIEQSEAELGPTYAVFANAGYGMEKPVLASTEDELRRMFEVNFWGSLNVIRPALPGMLERGQGHVLMCSSCISKLGVPCYAPYCSTKACQDMFGRVMRHELSSRGVHVSTIHPVSTRTEFFETAATQSGHEIRLMDRMTERFMQPAERVADAVVRCLRKPRGEVWTSVSTRLSMAFALACPGLADRALGRMARKKLGIGELP
ncbi:MAG: SDR family NAD(P)-dependent oxidoreductase [Phycisphaeraceae bacterium]|nr:MAG: SDR family NAD(P)-dependent oxidoreductase [Phycisphaeraceae bacterium]